MQVDAADRQRERDDLRDSSRFGRERVAFTRRVLTASSPIAAQMSCT